MKCMFCSLVFICAVSVASAQDTPRGIPEGGRWIVGGTFVLSNIGNNELRGGKSYSGAEKEVNRIATFLPGMTIIYNLERSTKPGRSGYLEGTTHHGIPVTVLGGEISTNAFGTRDTTDVVTHQSYTGCRDLACTSEAEVGIGFSFKIEEDDDERLVLYNPQSELRIVHTQDAFDQYEARGYTTRVLGRVHPRLKIHDGYASEISTGCGLTRPVQPPIRVPKNDYETQPSEWDVNSLNWSLKAIDLFGIGDVELNAEGTHYVGLLASEIGVGTESEGEPVALDFTVFAYRDSEWSDPEFYKFGGLAQTVTCRRKNPNVGQVLPRYVENAYLYFDVTGGERLQTFPLDPIQLPDQFESNKELQNDLRAYLPRAFFYSVNNAKQYKELFEYIVEDTKIAFPSAIANVIARLNASCGEQSRKECADAVDRLGALTSN
ncbi:hypothetical protein [Pelagibius sp.]|uniref:hypothetical protein n=1 Tax=Pelagibius sp. TaxID=1931238 RepID=UPI00261A3BBE|nr:hypothetical protein [Pelagibius sp.]